MSLTHWGWVTHIYVGNLTIIGSDNGLSPGRRQAITWTNVGILLIGPLGTNFSQMLIKIHTFSFKKTNLRMSSGKWRPFCLGLNVLNGINITRLSNDGIKLSPEPILIYHPCHSARFCVIHVHLRRISFMRNTPVINHKYEFKNYTFIPLQPHFPGANELINMRNV